MSVLFCHYGLHNVKMCSTEDVLVAECGPNLLRFSFSSFIHTLPLGTAFPFPAATARHVRPEQRSADSFPESFSQSLRSGRGIHPSSAAALWCTP